MNKVKILSLSCAILLGSNLVMLAVVFKVRAHDNRAIVVQKLHFNAQQTASYGVLVVAHQKTVRASRRQIADLKNKLYAQLKLENTPQKDTLITQICAVQKQLEYVNFNHFEDIKKLCTAEQLPDFEILTNELAQMFSAPHPKK